MQKLSRWIAFLVAVVLVLSVGLSLAEEDVPNASGSTLKLPASLTTVGVQAFYGDKALVDVVLPDSVKRIESKAFANSSVQTITLPAGITYIADDAFANCSNLVATVTKGSYAMQYCVDHSIAYVLAGAKKNYRALLIGEKTFLRGSWYYRYIDDSAIRNEGDVNNMATMLSSVYGNDGVGKFKVTKKIDLSYSQVKSAIRTTFADTTDSDVSLFFFASHGNSDGDGELEIAFTGDPDSDEDVEAYLDDGQLLPFSTLASWLTQYVKGEVIVIIESCGAGSAIYISDAEQNDFTLRNSGDDDFDFAAAAVRAFSRADPGIVADGETVPGDGEEDDPELHKTGELRLPKYYVLACSRHREVSWGHQDSNFFTDWLIEGVGSADSSPADTSPKDKAITLTELFNYIKKYDDYGFSVYEDGDYVTYYQHVQRYPVGSKYELFRFK